MGAARSQIVRSVKNFNVDYRAERQLDKISSVPKAAPRYKAEKPVDIDPSASKQIHERNEKLVQKVDQLKITESIQTGVVPGDEKGDFSAIVKESKRSLPQRMPQGFTSESDQDAFGYCEPKVVPAGKLTLKSAIFLIGDFKENPASLPELCDKYKIEEKQILDIVRNFFPYRLGDENEYKAMFEVHHKMLEGKPQFKDESKLKQPNKEL